MREHHDELAESLHRSWYGESVTGFTPRDVQQAKYLIDAGWHRSTDPYVDLVREFHQLSDSGDDDHVSLAEQSGETIDMRCRLIAEEAQEAIDAIRERDPVGASKELADLIYVAIGAALRFGIPIARVFAAVHASNMSKMGADGKPVFRADGKVLKGPNFRPAEPDVARILNEER